LAYRNAYHQNVLWEHAKWLAEELAANDKPDRVYEFCDFMGYAYFALRHPAIKDRTVVRVHTPYFMASTRPPGWKARLEKRWGNYRERFCLSRARHITTPSAAFVRERLPWLSGWEHVPNPLPPEPAVLARNASSVCRILFLGRVEPRKGVHILLRAFAELAKENPDITLTLVGAAVPGPLSRRVREVCDKPPEAARGRLTWEPPCAPENRDALFSRFDILAMPSLWENSPYAYFEGMAAGLLCLGSRTGEMKEAAAAFGGLSAAPGDEEDWLKALRSAHALWLDAAAREGLLTAQQAYLRERRDAIPGQMMDYYKRVVEGK